MPEIVVPTSDILLILNSIPGNHLIMLADSPKFTILDATDDYLRITHTNREDILNKGLFEVFPDKPDSNESMDERSLLELTFVRGKV